MQSAKVSTVCLGALLVAVSMIATIRAYPVENISPDDADVMMNTENFEYQQKIYHEQQELADRLIKENDAESSYALKRMSNLQFEISVIREAIKEKLSAKAQEMIADKFGEEFWSADTSVEPAQDTLRLLLAVRAFFRAKLAYLKATENQWITLTKLIKRYGDETDETKQLVRQFYLTSAGNPLNTKLEQETVDRLISQLGGQTSEAKLKEMFAEYDQLIDKHYGCNGCSTGSDSTPAPLGSVESVLQWVNEYVGPDVLNSIAESNKQCIVASEPSQPLSLEQAEEARNQYLVSLDLGIDPEKL